MENLEQEEVQEVKLIVSEEMRSYIYDMTKWCKLLAVFGFVLSAMLIIGSFSIGALINANPGMLSQLGPLAKGGSMGLTALYLVLGFVYLYPSLLLNRFAIRGKQGVLFGDQESLNAAVGSIKSLFKFIGILTIIVFVSYFLLVFIGGAALA